MTTRRGRLTLATLVSFFLASTAASAGEPDAGTPTGAEALVRIQTGNEAFASGKPKHPREDAKRIATTASEGQHPIVTVLSCSDSRVPPELILDQGVGDVFSVRVAGNVADVDELGSVEYGVGHLGTPLLVVLGHSKCGAVTAVATHAKVHGHIPELVDNIEPAVQATRARLPQASDQEIVNEAIKANVFQSIQDLLQKSGEIHERVEKGAVKVVGAVYDIGTGKIEWLGPHPQEAKLLLAGMHAEEKTETKREHGTKHEHGPKDAGTDAGEAAEDGKLEEHGHGKDSATTVPVSRSTFPIGLAVLAFLCTLGGALSVALGKKSS